MKNWEKLFAEALHKEFAKLQNKNNRYSLRAYAKKLGVSIGTLSEVMRFKLNLSRERAAIMLDKLELLEREKKRLLLAMGFSNASFEKVELKAEDHDLLADWSTRAILYSFDVEEGGQIQRIAKKLDLSQVNVSSKVEKLLEKGFLEKNEQGEIFRPKKFWKTADNKANEFIKKTHLSNLEVAEKALLNVPYLERDFTSLMFAGNEEQLDKVRQEIRQFYDRLLSIMEVAPCNKLYQASISIYPLHFDGAEGKDSV